MDDTRTLCAVLSIGYDQILRIVSEDEQRRGSSSNVRIEAVDARLTKVSGLALSVMHVIGALAYANEPGLISVA